MLTYVYPFSRIYLCLPLFAHVCLRMFTQVCSVYLCLQVFTYVYPFYPCVIVFTYVNTTLSIFTPVYLCLPMVTRFYQSLLLFSYV